MLPPMKYCSRCGADVERKVPGEDNRQRWVCTRCDTVHYQNPIIVVGCIAEKDGKILLCKRAIEPRHGYWTVPAGFMELGESLAEGAARETLGVQSPGNGNAVPGALSENRQRAPRPSGWS